MSRLMQLPVLFGVRGSIATQTMSNLTREQQDEINSIVIKISQDPALIADKIEFTKQLANTIGGDYRSNPDTAEHEFCVAIWRATVYLLYHRDYTYACALCGQTEYNTSKDKKKAFDRQYPICPHCNKSIYTHGHDNIIVHLKKQAKGYTLLNDENQSISEVFRKRAEVEVLLESPIKTIHGNPKVDNPRGILADDQQRGKWYSVWVWNYFRQILNENAITTHQHSLQICGPANLMALREIISELKLHGFKYHFDESTILDRDYEILVGVWATDPEVFTAFFLPLVRKYKSCGINISEHVFSIKIKSVEKELPMVSATITAEDPVIMISIDTPTNSTGGSDDRNWSDIVESNRADDGLMVGNTDDVAEEDWFKTIRRNIPTEMCRRVFDIYTQRGAEWAIFSEKFNPKDVAAKAHIAKYLGISTGVIDNCREVISDLCQELSADPGEDVNVLDLGDEVIMTTGAAPIVHLDNECEHLGNAEYQDIKILDSKYKFVMVEGIGGMVRACPHCCFN